MDARACPRRLLACAAIPLVLGITLGCSSVYHDVARHSPRAIGERLNVRRDHAIDAHDKASRTLTGMVSDLRERRAVRTRAARVERLQRERVELSRQIWRAKKAVASIEDVIVLDADGQIGESVRTDAGRIMGFLQRAGDELGLGLEAITQGVEQFANGSPVAPSEIDAVSAHTENARDFIARARGVASGESD